jgi:hypothetical protein
MRRDASLNTTAITNTSFESAGINELTLPKLDERLLKDLQQKRDRL